MNNSIAIRINIDFVDIFKIDQPPSKDLLALERDVELIESIWQQAFEWDQSWSQWKISKFLELETSGMEAQCQNTYKKLYKMSRDLRVSYRYHPT